MFNLLLAWPPCEELAELPSPEELHRAISCLSNNKALGGSGILPEMIKHGSSAFFSSLLSLLHKVWQEGHVPQDWRDAELVPVSKRGDLTLCDSWRGTALLDVVGNVVGSLIQTR